jgi:hypothetical protein
MTVRYFANASGVYLGAFGPGTTPPAGAIEVPAPADARQMWLNGAWQAAPPLRWRVLKSTLVERMTDAELASYLALIASLPDRDRARWDAIRYVASDDAQVTAAGAALGWSPARVAELLAPDPHPDAQRIP